MKRHHKKEFVFKSLVPVNCIYKCQHVKHTLFYNFKTQPSAFSKVVLIKIDSINLPNLDLYEVRANSFDGILVGYAIDCHGKNTINRHNFVGSSNLFFTETKMKDLNENNLSLKFTLGKMMLFEYEGSASLVTLGFGERMKEAMELN